METYQLNEYVVMNENTLGYVIGIGKSVISIAVVAADYLRGGDPLLINRATCALIVNCRKAQEIDKETFKYRF